MFWISFCVGMGVVLGRGSCVMGLMIVVIIVMKVYSRIVGFGWVRRIVMLIMVVVFRSVRWCGG